MRNKETTKNPIANSVTIDPSVLSAHVEGGIVGWEDGSLIITKYWQGPLHHKAKPMKFQLSIESHKGQVKSGIAVRSLRLYFHWLITNCPHGLAN